MWQTQSTGRTRVEQAIKQFLPPCQAKCPINEDIQRTNVLLSLLPDDLKGAKDGIVQIGNYLYDRNPLFGVCGYVCGLCELDCNYSEKGGAIRRRLLKRFVADHYGVYLEEKEEFDLVRSKEAVAVVGGGPAGLMAAFDLSKRGYRVTVFESSDRLGGALWLIPRYRLPEEVLRSAVENLVRIAGMDVKVNAHIGEGKLTLDRLHNDGYRAVFIARGSPTPRVLSFGREPVEGQELSGVMYGQTFLYEVSHGNIASDYFRGKRVVVIGGGNVAFDVARTAQRLGGDTALVCLECEDKTSRDGIPADHEEIKGAWEEGIRIVYSRGVRRIQGEGGIFQRIECPRCTSVFDENGFNPGFDLADTVAIEGDVLVIAVGQGPERAWLEREGLLDEAGRLAADPVTLQSRTREWVFVGGDMRRIGFLAEAMRDGLEASESIERLLRGLDVREGRTRAFEAQEIPLRRSYKHEPEVVWIPPEKRMHFQLFERGFTLQEAREEAKRCLTCGPCLSCKACVSVGLQPELPTVVVHEDRCSGCGICSSICYYGAAQPRAGADGLRSSTDLFRCKACGMCVVACPADAREMFGCDLDQRFERMLAAL
ncbi:MAG: FAD-dependent oxidoreductase [Deltaproteobacteria bacterium]|nr:FAD-dependent oxidoreductase [Deltaproteobacteria bacterium]